MEINEPTLGLTGDVGGSVPVQGDGMLDGHPWYFRARYEHWRFAVAEKPEDNPVVVGGGLFHSVGIIPGWLMQREWGFGQFSAGTMEPRTAKRLIMACARMYHAGTLPRAEVNPEKYAEENKAFEEWADSIRAASYCVCGHNQVAHGIAVHENRDVLKACLECECPHFEWSQEESEKQRV